MPSHADSLFQGNALSLLRFCVTVHDSGDMARATRTVAEDSELAEVCRYLGSPRSEGFEQRFKIYCADQGLNEERIYRRAKNIAESLRLDPITEKPFTEKPSYLNKGVMLSLLVIFTGIFLAFAVVHPPPRMGGNPEQTQISRNAALKNAASDSISRQNAIPSPEADLTKKTQVEKPAAPIEDIPSVLKPSAKSAKGVPVANVEFTALEKSLERPKKKEATVLQVDSVHPNRRPSLKERLQNFIGVYCKIYASKDLEQFMNLFAPHATELGKPIQSMLPEYKDTFEKLKKIQYSIRIASYIVHPRTGKIHLDGRFYTQYELQDGSSGNSSGNIWMQLSQQDDQFRVLNLAYTIERR